MKTSLRRIASLLPSFLLLFAAAAVIAQDLDDVTIAGRVTDSNGLAVVGATVTVTDQGSGAERTVTTNENGRYRLIELRPGIFKVKASASGFGAKERINLETLAGQNLQLDFNLSPADVQAEATVTVSDDDAPVVDTTRTIVGGTISAIEIEELPNANRNPLDLVLTLGGTAEESLSTSGLAEDRLQSPSSAPLEQGNFSLSGGTAYSNNITIDGLDNNDDRSSRDRFQPSLESIVEVQVIANQFSAEYGRASGGRINLRTRAGTNRYRGRAFFFFRDARMNANSWYNNSRTIERPPFTDWNPGFTFNGPVRFPGYNGRKKTFFAVAYEYDFFDDTTLIDAYLPEIGNPRFELPAPTGSTLSCDNANPAQCESGNAAYVAPYTKLYPTPNKAHILTARVDHKLFKNNDLTVGWQFGRKENLRTNGSAASRLDEAFQAKNINTDAINFTDNHVFNSKAVNQFRAQWSGYRPNYQTEGPEAPVVLISYRHPVADGVRTLIAGNSTTSSFAGFSDNRNETRWQVLDAFTYITENRHTIKTGFDYQHVDSKTKGLEDASGTFNFSSVLNFDNNNVARYRHNYGTREDVVNTYWAVFGNDEFNPFSHLTLSWGLRYERETAVTDSNNFGPRLGVAWDPFKNGKSVIRFGTGIFYNRVLLRTVANNIQTGGEGLIRFDSNTIFTGGGDDRREKILAAIANNFPMTYPNIQDLRQLIVQACTTVNSSAPCNENTGFVTNVSSGGNPLRSVEPDLKIPESYQFNVGFEREIAKGFVFEANYTWNKTVHLWRDYNWNAPSLELANSILGTNYADWTDYLVNNPFQLSPTRMYTFYLGPPTDTTGHHANSMTGGNCGVATANCFVNLNTTNSSTTTPLVAASGQNNNATGAPIGIALAAIAQFRPDSSIEEASRIGSHGNAFYRGLILQLRRRYRQLGHGFGMSIRGAYTLSSTRDDGLNNTANAEINGDFGREWARNLQDRRHRIAVTGVFQTPYWFGKLRLSPVFRYGSSGRFNLGIGGSDRNLDDLGTDRLNYSGDIKDVVWRNPGTPFPSDLAALFSLQPIGARGGNLPRNAGTSPSFYTYDLGVNREWKIGERMKLRPFAEFNNILNAAVFNFGAEFINYGNLYLADNVGDNATDAQKNTQALARANFLVPTRTYRQRYIRFGVRFDF